MSAKIRIAAKYSDKSSTGVINAYFALAGESLRRAEQQNALAS